MRPSDTCYHLNYHCRWKILLILRNLNKKQGINAKKCCSSWENKASYQELSTENLSDPELSKLVECSWINQYQLDPRLSL